MDKSIKIFIYFTLFIIIITSIIAIFILKYNSRPDEELTLKIYDEYDKIINNTKDVETNYDDINFSQEFLNTIKKTNDNANVVATINIPKINVVYPVTRYTTDELLKIAPTKLFGPNPNMVGNFCIVGHNNKDRTMFSNISKLEKGDIIKLTSANGYERSYIVNNKYEVFESDTSCTNQNTDGKREVTLITCTNNINKRLVVKCLEE